MKNLNSKHWLLSFVLVTFTVSGFSSPVSASTQGDKPRRAIGGGGGRVGSAPRQAQPPRQAPPRQAPPRQAPPRQAQPPRQAPPRQVQPPRQVGGGGGGRVSQPPRQAQPPKQVGGGGGRVQQPPRQNPNPGNPGRVDRVRPGNPSIPGGRPNQGNPGRVDRSPGKPSNPGTPVVDRNRGNPSIPGGRPNQGNPGRVDSRPGQGNPGRVDRVRPGNPGQTNPGRVDRTRPGNPGNPGSVAGNPGRVGRGGDSIRRRPDVAQGQGRGQVRLRPNDRIRGERPVRSVSHQTPSHLGRNGAAARMKYANDRAQGLHARNRDVSQWVGRRSHDWDRNYRRHCEAKTVIVKNYYHDHSYRHYYEHWYRHGFYGGYYYPVRPVVHIHTYFWYPILYWLYVDAVDEAYYRGWYDAYDRYPVRPFRYARVYYPTDTLRDLGIEVSAMPEVRQLYFRTAMNNLTEDLTEQISYNLGYSFALQENDIVLTHYEYLENSTDRGIVVEGFVDRGDLHVAFKALLDLNDPEQSLVFVPVDRYPSDEDLYILNLMNQRIVNLGGDPLRADEEPVSYQ